VGELDTPYGIVLGQLHFQPESGPLINIDRLDALLDSRFTTD
jgi:hypothetical protein